MKKLLILVLSLCIALAAFGQQASNLNLDSVIHSKNSVDSAIAPSNAPGGVTIVTLDSMTPSGDAAEHGISGLLKAETNNLLSTTGWVFIGLFAVILLLFIIRKRYKKINKTS